MAKKQWWPPNVDPSAYPVYRAVEERLDPRRPIKEIPTHVEGPTCGRDNHLYIIAKVQAGLPLSIAERDLVAETLRHRWLTPKEWRLYRAWSEVRLYEQAQGIADPSSKLKSLADPDSKLRPEAPDAGVPHGQREKWMQDVYGKNEDALKGFIGRRRRKLKGVVVRRRKLKTRRKRPR
jgi:hypothetical protein